MLETAHEGLHFFFFFQRYNRFAFCDIVLWIKQVHIFFLKKNYTSTLKIINKKSTHFLDILSKLVEFELTHLTRNDPNSLY